MQIQIQKFDADNFCLDRVHPAVHVYLMLNFLKISQIQIQIHVLLI